MKKRFNCARAQSENSQRKLEKYMKAATKDRVKRQLVSDGKLILHKIVKATSH